MSISRQVRRMGVATAAALSLFAGSAVAAQASIAEPEQPTAEAVVTLDIFSINDFHGRIQAEAQSAGAAVLAGAVAKQREANANTLFVSAGDNIGASTFASASQQDNPTIEALGAAGLDLSVVGNHEFDRSFDDLSGRVIDRYAAATGTDGTDYALGANVYRKGTTTPALKEYAIREIDGVQVGFIGTVTAETATLVSPSGITELEFGDQLQAANRVAEQLSDGNESNGEAEVLVLLTHDGSESTSCDTISAEDTDYGKLIRGASADIDAIFSGHTHQAYDCEIPVGGGSQSRPVIQAHQYGTTLGKISLEVDPESGEVQESSGELIPLTEEDGEGNWTPLFAADSQVAGIVDEAVEESEVVGNQEIGQISADILRGGEVPGSDRGVESTLGNTIADVHLWATSNEDFGGEPAQIAFMNPGGLRADLLYGEDGTVTYKAAADVQPFANTLITLDLTGAQLREVLEQQWQPVGSSRSKLHLGISEGLSYTYLEDAARGEHIKTVTFDGKPVKDSDSFRVAANAFLASGGDNFTAFAEGANHADSGQVDLDATVNYFKSHAVVDPAPLGRAVLAGTDWATVSLSSSTAAPGETIDVQVSGLAEGAVISAEAFDGDVTPGDIAPADASGTTGFEMAVPTGQAEGEYSLVISQVGREDITVPLVVATEPTAEPTEEPTPSETPTATPTASAEPTNSQSPDASPSQTQGPDRDDDLADTGFSASVIGIVAGIVLLAGIILLLLRSRGSRNTH